MIARQLLYIDDDEDDQELFQMAITEISNAFNCIAAYDATSALQKLISWEWKPDAIFLDLNMPEMSGRDFLKAIRAINELKDIPVFVLSTSSQPAIIQMVKEMGARDFITKPGSYPELVRILQSLLMQ